MSIKSWLPEDLAKSLMELFRDQRVWLVGGAVRDRLLKRTGPDLDFVVEGNARALARRIANSLAGGYYDLDRERDAGRVILASDEGKGRTLDFAALRGGDILQDLYLRDFTINALAVSLDEPDRIIDPTHGLQDLKDKRLRACHERSIEQDAVRALRAVRIAAELDLSIDPHTVHLIKKGAELISSIAAERIRDEIFRMLDFRMPGRPIRILAHMGLLWCVLPELEWLQDLPLDDTPSFDAWRHTLSVVDGLSSLLIALEPAPLLRGAIGLTAAQAILYLGRFRRYLNADLAASLSHGRDVRQVMFLAALYHETGRAQSAEAGDGPGRDRSGPGWGAASLVRRRAQKLRLSRAEVERAAQITEFQTCLDGLESGPKIEARQVYRFFNRTGRAGVEVVLLWLADLMGRYAASPPQDAWIKRLEMAGQLFGAYYEPRDIQLNPRKLINGSDLARYLGVQSGPAIGRLLEEIREAQAIGEIETREAALDFARRALQKEHPPRHSGG